MSVPTAADNKSMPDKQQVLERIEAQRVRLRERHVRRIEAVAMTRDAKRVAGLGPDAPLASRVAVFARLHPVVFALAAGVAVVIGPRKLLRWTGVVLPFVMKMRGR